MALDLYLQTCYTTSSVVSSTMRNAQCTGHAVPCHDAESAHVTSSRARRALPRGGTTAVAGRGGTHTARTGSYTAALELRVLVLERTNARKCRCSTRLGALSRLSRNTLC